MRPSQPASAPSSARWIASAVVRAATPATSGARPASASRQRRRTAFFSSNESEPPSPSDPRATMPVQPARTSASTCFTRRSASTEKSGLKGVVIAGRTPCHFMAARIARSSRLALVLPAMTRTDDARLVSAFDALRRSEARGREPAPAGGEWRPRRPSPRQHPDGNGRERRAHAVGREAAEEAERRAAHAALAGAHAGARVQLRLARRAGRGEAAERDVLAAADDRVGARRETVARPAGRTRGPAARRRPVSRARRRGERPRRPSPGGGEAGDRAGDESVLDARDPAQLARGEDAVPARAL